MPLDINRLANNYTLPEPADVVALREEIANLKSASRAVGEITVEEIQNLRDTVEKLRSDIDAAHDLNNELIEVISKEGLT